MSNMIHEGQIRVKLNPKVVHFLTAYTTDKKHLYAKKEMNNKEII